MIASNGNNAGGPLIRNPSPHAAHIAPANQRWRPASGSVAANTNAVAAKVSAAVR